MFASPRPIDGCATLRTTTGIGKYDIRVFDPELQDLAARHRKLLKEQGQGLPARHRLDVQHVDQPREDSNRRRWDERGGHSSKALRATSVVHIENTDAWLAQLC